MRNAAVVFTGSLALLVIVLVLRPSASADGSLAALQGSYSVTGQGSFSACLLPSGSEVPCNTSGAAPFPFIVAETGQITVGPSGSACATITAVAANLPPGAPSPLVGVGVDHEVLTVTGYNAAVETGDIDSKAYIGGNCNGVVFDPTGATLFNNFTYHFVVTHDGDRWDLIVTKWTDPQGGIAQFVVTDTFLKQSGREGNSEH